MRAPIALAGMALGLVMLARPVSFVVVGCAELAPVGGRADDGNVLVEDGAVAGWVVPGQSYCLDPRVGVLYIWDGAHFVPIS
jgi:hypothetical protein